jgi:hypothetical protein
MHMVSCDTLDIWIIPLQILCYIPQHRAVSIPYARESVWSWLAVRVTNLKPEQARKIEVQMLT